jgi:TFIIF-interacting CTD phosphatase-like protein
MRNLTIPIYYRFSFQTNNSIENRVKFLYRKEIFSTQKKDNMNYGYSPGYSLHYSGVIPNYPGKYETLTDKCIVLDLDETLVHTCEEYYYLERLGILTNPYLLDIRKRIYRFSDYDMVTRRGEGVKSTIWGIMRPGLEDFLKFCINYFNVVCIWSAGHTKYVDGVCNWIFRDTQGPHKIYTQPDCLNTKGYHEKPLWKMISDPDLTDVMNLENTFIVDDKQYTYENYNPDNAILIPPYKPDISIEGFRKDDQSLRLLMKWFMTPEVIESTDIQKLDKSQIFPPFVANDD